MISEQCEAQNMKQSDYRFSRKAVRGMSGWTDFQVKKHMQRLEDMEYVLIHRGRRGQSYEYELLYQGEGASDQPFLMGLIDTNKLQCDAKKKPLKTNNKPLLGPRLLTFLGPSLHFFERPSLLTLGPSLLCSLGPRLLLSL